MLEARELSPTGMEGQVRTAPVGECLRCLADVRSPRDALVGDRMQPRQRFFHVNFIPGLMRAPRSHSSVRMRALPVGCTSKISMVPPAVSLNGPVAISSD